MAITFSKTQKKLQWVCQLELVLENKFGWLEPTGKGQFIFYVSNFSVSVCDESFLNALCLLSWA
jgi:hypothetical protein